MKQLNQFNVQDYLEIAVRRKWLIFIPFILITLGGIIYSFSLPPLYQTSTLILVQAQRVPETYVKPTVTAGVEERLQTISQEIMSRTRLESIISELNLYPDLRKTLFMEEVVDKMRKDISLEVKGKDAFQLFYQGKEPRLIATVANRLASLFIEENLKFREDMAEGTTEFLDRELIRIKKTLEVQEAALGSFKESNLGALPEQLDANLRSLEQSQLQLQTVSTSLQNARDRRVSLQNQIAQVSNLKAEMGSDLVQVDSPETAQGGASLGEMKDILAQFQVRYKDKHPDVVRLKNQIKKMEEEAKLQEEKAAAEENIKEEPISGEEKTASGSTPEPTGATYSLADTMTAELEGIDLEIRRLSAEQERIKTNIAVFQKRIEDTPKREQDLQSLQRDYENTRKNYESLLDKKLNAQIAANMEKMQKGERFKVLDTARIPEKPFKPNRPRIFLLALLLGLAAGFGLAFGMEYIDHSFRDVDDLEHFLELPVLAAIPRIVTGDDVNKKNRMKIAVASSVGLLALVVALTIIHFFIMRLDFWVTR